MVDALYVVDEFNFVYLNSSYFSSALDPARSAAYAAQRHRIKWILARGELLGSAAVGWRYPARNYCEAPSRSWRNPLR